MAHARTRANLTLVPTDDPTIRNLIDGYLTAYRGNTYLSYAADIARWRNWTGKLGVDLLNVKRVHVELYRKHLEDCGLKPATVARHLICVAGLYRYAEEEELIDRSPARYVKRPRVPPESTSAYLDREEMGRFLFAAERIGTMAHAAAALMLLNGLRVSEATSATIGGLGFDKGHRTLRIVRKGGLEATVPLAPRTARAILLSVGERSEGPILLNTVGAPMSRHNAGRLVRRIARVAGIDKKIGPHALRHSFCTAALDAGVGVRDVQTGMGHAQPSTTMRYDRSRFNLDRHCSYVVAAFVAGGS